MKRRLADGTHDLWAELAALLRLGCAPMEGGGAAMPWIFAKAPESADPYAAMLALGPAVAVHAKADAASTVTGRLDWAVVEVAQGFDPDAPFAEVKLPGGGAGFVETAKLRSLIDYRLLATRTPQGWRITALIAGD
jgi:hypothetical protein